MLSIRQRRNAPPPVFWHLSLPQRRKAVRPSTRARCRILLFNPIPHSHGVSSVPERAVLRVAVSCCGLPRVAETRRHLRAGKTKPRLLGRGAKPHAAFIQCASGAGCQTREAPLQGLPTLRGFSRSTPRPAELRPSASKPSIMLGTQTESGSRICPGSRWNCCLQSALSDSAG